MSDPRFTDPHYSDDRFSQPVLRRNEGVGGIWGWVVGLAVVALIAFIVAAGWHGDGTNTASTGKGPSATAAIPHSAPSTTGSGATSPQPVKPPSTPAR